MLQASNDANLHAIEMQRKMSYPMIGVGLEYMINKETNMPKMEDMNGNNMFMAMFKLTLPIHRRNIKQILTQLNTHRYLFRSNMTTKKICSVMIFYLYNRIY